MGISNRELATVILFAAFAALVLLIPSVRRGVLPSIGALCRALLNLKILGLFAVYFSYAAALVTAAWAIGMWEVGFLKDTLIVTFFVGLPLVANAAAVRSGRILAAKVAKQTIGVSAFLAFYLGIVSLPVWGELLVQFILGSLILVGGVASLKRATAGVAGVCNVFVGLIALFLLIFTTVRLARDWSAYDLGHESLSFAVTIWLPILLIPFVYACAFVFQTENILRVMPFFNDRKPIRRRVRFALVAGLHLRAVYSSAFVGLWRDQLGKTSTYSAARAVMKEFRAEVRKTNRAEKERLAKLKRLAGVPGVDESGLRLDRREFGATKKVLKDLHFMEMGSYRNGGKHYKEGLLDLLGGFTSDGLPADHGIVLEVTKNKKAWRAWRATPGGWYFAVGGTSDLEREWEYDGEGRPGSFPGNHDTEWVDVSGSARSPEWSAYDGAEV